METSTLLAAVRCCVTTTLAAYIRLTLAKRLPKLKFEPISFLFLACFHFESFQYYKITRNILFFLT